MVIHQRLNTDRMLLYAESLRDAVPQPNDSVVGHDDITRQRHALYADQRLY